MRLIEHTIFMMSNIRVIFCGGSKEKIIEKLQLLAVYVRLSLKYLFFVKLFKCDIQHEKFLNLKISFPDYEAFYGMFSEIFIHEEYAFEAKRKDPVIVDCGGNIGMSVLYFKKKYPASKIVCFEPHKRMFDYLTKNICDNNLKDIELHNVAVCNRNGEISIYSSAESRSLVGTSITQCLLEKYNKLHEESIGAVMLSDYIKESVDLLKMDIEGAETLVIEELSQSAKLNNIREMIIEYHYNPETNPINTLSSLLAPLERGGFLYCIYSPIKLPFLRTKKSFNALVYAHKEASE